MIHATSRKASLSRAVDSLSEACQKGRGRKKRRPASSDWIADGSGRLVRKCRSSFLPCRQMEPLQAHSTLMEAVLAQAEGGDALLPALGVGTSVEQHLGAQLQGMPAGWSMCVCTSFLAMQREAHQTDGGFAWPSVRQGCLPTRVWALYPSVLMLNSK